jgi:hypothetical protein
MEKRIESDVMLDEKKTNEQSVLKGFQIPEFKFS